MAKRTRNFENIHREGDNVVVARLEPRKEGGYLAYFSGDGWTEHPDRSKALTWCEDRAKIHGVNLRNAPDEKIQKDTPVTPAGEISGKRTAAKDTSVSPRRRNTRTVKESK